MGPDADYFVSRVGRHQAGARSDIDIVLEPLRRELVPGEITVAHEEMIGLDGALTVPTGPFVQDQRDFIYVRRKRFTLIGPHPLTVGAGAGVCVREPDDADAVVLLRRMAQPSRNRQAIALGVASDGIHPGGALGGGTGCSPA